MSSSLTVGVYVFEDAEELDVVGPWEVFGFWAAHVAEFSVRLLAIGREEGVVRCAKGLRLVVGQSLARAPALDLLVRPGGDGARPLAKDSAHVDWLGPGAELGLRVVGARGRHADAGHTVADERSGSGTGHGLRGSAAGVRRELGHHARAAHRKDFMFPAGQSPSGCGHSGECAPEGPAVRRVGDMRACSRAVAETHTPAKAAARVSRPVVPPGCRCPCGASWVSRPKAGSTAGITAPGEGGAEHRADVVPVTRAAG